MKLLVQFVFVLVAVLFTSITAVAQVPTGAWRYDKNDIEHVVVFADRYMSHAAFNKAGKRFVMTSGGPYEIVNKEIVVKVEYNSAHPQEAGETKRFGFVLDGKKMTITLEGNQIPFTTIDDGTGPLAGTWRMSGRVQDGKQSAMAAGARKTLKILSGSRFQWFAINPETKEFFGTGGGSYTFKDGKYTEQLEFFPRDSSRVGMSLTFDDKVEGKDWHHTGKSSQGAPIHEIWSRVN